MPYDYDAQIKRLTENPQLIKTEWATSTGLFRFATTSSHRKMRTSCGCLTMIRSDPDRFKAVINGKIDSALTSKIISDKRIPVSADDIRQEHLLVFKEYQVLIDSMGRDY